MAGVAEAVERLLDSVDLDEGGEARAAIARTLAAKLDQTQNDDSAAASMAMPGIAKELRAVIDHILDASGEAAEFVSGLFSEVGNSANT